MEDFYKKSKVLKASASSVLNVVTTVNHLAVLGGVEFVTLTGAFFVQGQHSSKHKHILSRIFLDNNNNNKVIFLIFKC